MTGRKAQPVLFGNAHTRKEVAPPFGDTAQMIRKEEGRLPTDALRAGEHTDRFFGASESTVGSHAGRDQVERRIENTDWRYRALVALPVQRYFAA